MGISFIRKIYDYHIKDDYRQEITTVPFLWQMLVYLHLYAIKYINIIIVIFIYISVINRIIMIYRIQIFLLNIMLSKVSGVSPFAKFRTCEEIKKH